MPFLWNTQEAAGFALHCFFFFGPDTVQFTCGTAGCTGGGGTRGGGGLAGRISLQMSSAG